MKVLITLPVPVEALLPLNALQAKALVSSSFVGMSLLDRQKETCCMMVASPVEKGGVIIF